MSLASNDSQEEKIRKSLIDNDLVDCIVTLPDKLFTSTPIGACIWILNKNKNNEKSRLRRNEVLFIDATHCFNKVNRTLNNLSSDNIKLIADTYRQWISPVSEYKDRNGFCKTVHTDLIINNKYSIFPAAYIDSKTTFEEKSSNEKYDLFSEINELIDELKEIEPGCLNFLDELMVHDDENELFKIGDVLEQSKERLGNRDEPEILTCTENAGLIFQRERFSKRVATEDTSKYKYVYKSDIVYNPYLLWAGAIDQCWVVDEGITSPAYEVFKIKEGFDPVLVGIALKSEFMKQKYDGISVGTVKRRRRAPPEKFLELDIRLPSKDKQNKTIENSNNIQNVIFIHSKIIRLYKELSLRKYENIIKLIQ